jgi:copper(I)-binding protein
MRLNTTVILTMLLCGLAVVSQSADGKSPAAVQADSAWATPAGQGQIMAAAYISLRNRGKTPQILLGASTKVAAEVQMHSSEIKNGIARMRRIERLAVPARGELKLTPGGPHLMLMGLNRPLKAGDTITVHLRFEDGAILDVPVPVTDTSAKSAMKGEPHANH